MLGVLLVNTVLMNMEAIIIILLCLAPFVDAMHSDMKRYYKLRTYLRNEMDRHAAGQNIAPDVRLDWNLDKERSENEGRVELFIDGHWGTVCDHGWDNKDAAVVCRMLGYKSGIAIVRHDYTNKGSVTKGFWIHLVDVDCSGDEKNILDCNYKRTDECSHREDAGVTCFNDGQVRLVDGPTSNSGRVQIGMDGVWSEICDDSWNRRDAHVVCRMLGYDTGHSFHLSNFGYGRYSFRYFDSVMCSGDENSIFDCETHVNDHCRVRINAGVVCLNDIDVRLVNVTGPHEGRVELSIHGLNTTVCDDTWDNSDAQVVCRQLGMNGGKATGIARFCEGRGIIFQGSIYCRGSEAELTDCDIQYSQHRCRHYEDAAVICDEATRK